MYLLKMCPVVNTCLFMCANLSFLLNIALPRICFHGLYDPRVCCLRFGEADDEGLTNWGRDAAAHGAVP